MASERLEPGADELRRRLDPELLPFRTTEQVEPLEGTIGQPRALAALFRRLSRKPDPWADIDAHERSLRKAARHVERLR